MMITDTQKELIEAMNEFCTEKFDLSYQRTKQEASEYISKNIEEYKEPLLTKEEKEYLSAVIKPFRNEIKFILFSRYSIDFYKDNEDWCYLYKKENMFSKLNGKEYSLEELGLF